MTKIIIVLVLGVFLLTSCSDDPYIALQAQMTAMTAWKVQTQASLNTLQTGVADLQAQQKTYSKSEVDAMIKKLKDDQSWIKTEVVIPSSPTNPSLSLPAPSVGASTWKYGTYQIEGITQDIYFRGQSQTWKIVAVNTSQSSALVSPQISYKMYVPKNNVYTSSGASLTWDNNQRGSAFDPNGILCGRLNMPVGINMTTSGLNNLSLSVIPNVSDFTDESSTNFTNSLTINPNCGGTNGLGNVLVSPGQSIVWTLSVSIDTYQNSVMVNGVRDHTNYSSGPWSMTVSFATD